jgi:hypothetical protein
MRNLKKLGKVLGKKEQKKVNGGGFTERECNGHFCMTVYGVTGLCIHGKCIYVI